MKFYPSLQRILALILILALVCLSACDIPFKNGNDVTDNDVSDNDIGGGGSQSGGGNVTEPCQPHYDINDNGYCDNCNEYLIVVIDFYAINDLHGRIFDTDKQPGVDELTTYIRNAEKSDDHTIVLSSGDMWQGTAESNLTNGNMMTEWLNEIGVAAMTLGNHEFDWTREDIYANAELAEFPFLAINIYSKQTNERVDFAQPSVIVECGNAKIGIIGAIGDCHSSISQEKVTDIYFKVGNELSNLVKEESQRLRAQGCDYIVYSIHDGAEKRGTGSISNSDLAGYYDISLSNGYVDLVFEGHTHQNYVFKDSKGIYHIQGGAENDALSHVEIKLNYVNDTSRVNAVSNVSSNIYDDCTPDSVINDLKEKYKDRIDKADELLGVINRTMRSDELRQIIADLYLEAGIEKWGSEYNIVLGGGYIGVRSPYNLYAGEVRYEDLYTIFPFDNELCLCTISGYYLKQKFINTTNSNYFISLSDYGETLNIQDNATYYVIVDSYSAYYAPNRLTVVQTYGEAVYARDLLAEYIKGLK